MSPEDLFLSHLGLIERLVSCSCRRYHFRREECEDFGSIVKLKLIDDDYRVIRSFQGKSTIETYLAVVVQRELLDHFNRLWGKWRPSAKALRLGREAVWLEKQRRDGASFDEACEFLRTNHHVEKSRSELAAIAAKLPQRAAPLRWEGEEQLAAVPAADSSPEQRLREQERGAARDRVSAALKRALAKLPKEDRAILMLWEAGMPISRIARCLGLEQKPLYRRMERIHQTLRRLLREEGVESDDIRDILDGD